MTALTASRSALPPAIIDLLRILLTARVSADGYVRIELPNQLVAQAAIAAGVQEISRA